MKRLKVTFNNLGFDVKVLNNFKRREIFIEIKKLRENLKNRIIPCVPSASRKRIYIISYYLIIIKQ